MSELDEVVNNADKEGPFGPVERQVLICSEIRMIIFRLLNKSFRIARTYHWEMRYEPATMKLLCPSSEVTGST